MNTCKSKRWEVNNRDITEDEALKFVYPVAWSDSIPTKFDKDAISEDKANILACVYGVDLYHETRMYYFGYPYRF